ncbi:MAG: hypothetical protein LBV74_19065, partial [Tannerella sp.]|nr:hypothetical protein [Tannerella sp.]
PIRTNKNLRFTLGGGYAYRLGKIEKTGNAYIDDFTKKLRHGFNLDASGQLFFTKNIGVGINAIYIRLHAVEPDKIIPSITGYTTIKMNETTQFFYLGPSFVASTRLSKIMCYGEGGAGLLVFHDSGEVIRINASITKPTVGFHLGFSPEYRFSSQFGIGLKLSMTAGFIRTSFYGTDEERLNVSNLNIGTFISFRTR